MTTTCRPEISVNDLAAVMAAAKLLRSYDLISVAKIREIRLAVHDDATVIMERDEGATGISYVANQVWRETVA